jgi:hypothetical protein
LKPLPLAIMDVRAVARYATGGVSADVYSEVFMSGSVVAFRWLRRYVIGRRSIKSVTLGLGAADRDRVLKLRDSYRAKGWDNKHIAHALGINGIDLIQTNHGPLGFLCNRGRSRLAQVLCPIIRVTDNDLHATLRRACLKDDAHMLRVLRVTYRVRADAVFSIMISNLRNGVTNEVFRELMRFGFVGERHSKWMLAGMMPRAPREQFLMMRRAMEVPHAALVPYLNNNADSWSAARAKMLREIFGD